MGEGTISGGGGGDGGGGGWKTREEKTNFESYAKTANRERQ